MPEYPGQDVKLPKLPDIGQYHREDVNPQLSLNNWLQARGVAPGLDKLLRRLFPQIYQQYQLDWSNVFAPGGTQQPAREFGARSLMPWGTGDVADTTPFWEWLGKTNPYSLYSSIMGEAGPGGQQQDLGFRKSRF